MHDITYLLDIDTEATSYHQMHQADSIATKNKSSQSTGADTVDAS